MNPIPWPLRYVALKSTLVSANRFSVVTAVVPLVVRMTFPANFTLKWSQLVLHQSLPKSPINAPLVILP